MITRNKTAQLTRKDYGSAVQDSASPRSSAEAYTMICKNSSRGVRTSKSHMLYALVFMVQKLLHESDLSITHSYCPQLTTILHLQLLLL